MEKTKVYTPVHFSADVLKKAAEAFRNQVESNRGADFTYSLRVEVEDAGWKHDSLDEFYSDYRKMSNSANFWVYGASNIHLNVMLVSYWRTHVTVAGLTRPEIETVFEVFEQHVDECRQPEEPSSDTPNCQPSIFIGHGRSRLWRDLKDHLQDQHGYDVQAYEIGARAGHAIRDILDEMVRKSAFAILVMTGEDETIDHELLPRLNVVHELGLFQGSLGFSRAIMLLEEGTKEFSNMEGIHQIRFTKDNIRETFGDVLATIDREFSDDM